MKKRKAAGGGRDDDDVIVAGRHKKRGDEAKRDKDRKTVDPLNLKGTKKGWRITTITTKTNMKTKTNNERITAANNHINHAKKKNNTA